MKMKLVKSLMWLCAATTAWVVSAEEPTIKSYFEPGDGAKITVSNGEVKELADGKIIVIFTDVEKPGLIELDPSLLMTSDFFMVGGGGNGGKIDATYGQGANGGDAGEVKSVENIAVRGSLVVLVGDAGASSSVTTETEYSAEGGKAGSSTPRPIEESANGSAGAGSGTTSDVTGSSVVYGIGGAGGAGAGNSPQDGANAEANTGNGGGGAGAGCNSGAGASGIVIVTVKSVEVKAIDLPTPKDLTYDKSEQAALETTSEYIVLNDADSVRVATNAGTYVAKVKPAAGYWWRDTLDDSVRDVTWTIKPLEIEKPTATPASFDYDGEEHTVTASENEAYVYLNEDKMTVLSATHAGMYTLTAELQNPEGVTNYVWKGEAEDYRATGVGYWRVASITVPRPVYESEFVYSGENNIAVTLGEHMQLAEIVEGMASVTNATDVGTYSFRVKLDNEEGYSDYVWADGDVPTAADMVVSWRVKRATNEFTRFEYPGWRLGSGAPAPDVVAAFGEATLMFAASEDAEEEAWTSAVPQEPGTWYVRAHVPGTVNYTGIEEIKSFFLWRDADDIFTDFVEIAVPGYTASETLNGFVVPVRLSESAMPGFKYNRVGNPEGLAFVMGDKFLAYEVENWNPAGESVVWVKIPELTANTKLTMCWHGANGPTIAGSNAAEVWSDYHGVWHFGESIAAGEGNRETPDATGNGYTAVPFSKNTGAPAANQMISVEGVLGNARRVSSGAYSSGPRFEIANSEALALNGSFTISGWYNMTGEGSGGQNGLYLATTKAGINGANGWYVQVNSRNNRSLFGQGAGSGQNVTATIGTGKPTQAGWTYFAYTFDATTLRVLGINNGAVGEGSGTINAADDNGNAIVFGNVSDRDTGFQPLVGAFDEFRISKSPRTAEWLELEHKSVIDPAFTAKGLVVVEGKKVNEWTSLPTLSPLRWNVADVEEGKTTISVGMGSLREGEVKVAYYRFEDTVTPLAVTKPEEIKNAGRYFAVFTMADETGYEPISYAIEFTVVVHMPYTDLGGNAGDSGRVLIMNRDLNPKGPVDYQGYYDTTSEEKTTYWEHLELDPVESTSMNLMAAIKSELKSAAGKVLWSLKDCRQGNVFPKSEFDAMPLPGKRAYLPWESATAARFDGRAEAALTRSGAGTIVMRNTGDAVVTSSRFEDGIGTIYFDAVNNWVDDTGSNTVIAVELENEDGSWSPIEEVTVYKKDGTEGFTSETMSGAAIPLAITTGGTAENFYRIVATVNTSEPARMRIVRMTWDDDLDPDQASLISLDNIIVSAPPMRADLEPTGFYDPTKRGRDVLGWELATSVAYPNVGSSEIRPRAKAVFVQNSGDGKTIDPQSFVASATLRYRWRYLGQALDPAEGWNSAALAWNENGLLEATQPIRVPERIGDIEFYYETLLSAPYYEYVDYTGLDLGVAKTEEVEAVTNRREGETLPSGGTDWFFRLREGASRYEAIKMIVERKNKAGDFEPWQTVNFESTDDKQWRGFLKTTIDDKDSDSRITFIALEPKDTTGEDTALVTNIWKAIQSVTEVPVAVTFDKTVELDKWQNLKIDAVTGYIMFQLNEETHTIALTHADYQNFNAWSDAHKAGGVFVGNSTEDEKKVGVDETARDFAEDFSTAIDTPATDTEWQESFTTGTLETYVPFQTRTTPNGWQAKQGQYVHQQYRSSSGYAFQLVGQGYGELEYPGLTRDPRGLESVSFRARLAERLGFNDIAFYDVGKVASKKMTNYTFITQAAMTEHGWLTGSDRSADDFDGAGQLSIVGAYQGGVGCYELRVTRIAVDTVRLELFKWKGDKATSLVVHDYSTTTFHKWRAKNSDEWQYGTLFMSIDKQGDGVRVTAGLSNGHSLLATDSQPSNYHTLRYYDNTAPYEYGTFGVASANCPALFVSMRSYDGAVNWDDGIKPGRGGFYTNTGIVFNKGEGQTAAEEVDVEGMTAPTGRLVAFEDVERRTDRVGLKAKVEPQKLYVQMREKGKTADWVTIGESEVGGFTLADEVTIAAYRPEDATYRIIHGGTPDDARTDIVVDDVVLRQFRGTDYGNYDTEYEPNDGYGWRNEFVYTGAWIKSNNVKLSAKRTLPGSVSGIRSPLMDGNGNPKRGLGLGMLSFAYQNAQANARLLVQVATNNVTGTALVNEGDWVTVDAIDFSEMSADDRQSGVISKYLGLHEVQGMIRLIVDPNVITMVQGETDTRRFGEVEIRNILVRDEPKLTARSWWGWNIRLINGDGTSSFDDGSRTYLYDWGVNAGDMGFSLALNNSVTANVIREEADLYKEHMPFLQTPTLLENVIGEISFKAKLFDATQERPAEIRLYGTTVDRKYVDETDWELIPDAHFLVTNDVYETYHYRTAGTNYRAMRIAVTGVDGVTLGAKGPQPLNPPASRVLIDEVVVGEAVFPKVGFRYVYPVRTNLDTHEKSKAYDEDTDTANCDEQPLLGENWTVQAEIQVKQLPDEIDLTKTPIVKFYWIENTATTPWGFKNWRDLPDANVAELKPIDDTWVFRGSFARTPSAIVKESEKEGTIVQYMASVTYWDKEGRSHVDVMLDKGEWITPEWFNPVNPNRYQKDFSAFTILETIAPHRAWINEANVFDGYDSAELPAAAENQFVEIAVPTQQSLEGWRLEYVDSNYNTYPLCSFGEYGVDAEVTEGPVTNDYTFLVVRSPASANGTVWVGKKRIDGSEVAFNGTWNSATGELDIGFPIALRLIRPSDVVAQEIVLMGDNFWKGTAWEDQYSSEPFADGLNSGLGGHIDARFYVVGDEIDNEGVTGPEGRSLGVFAKTGATKEEWNNTMNQTPGWVNSNQVVPKNYVIRPNSALVIVRAMLGDKHLLQQVGDLAPTADEVKVTIPKRNPEGIKIVYTIADWYELDELTTNAVAIAGAPGALKTFEIVVGANAEKAIDVIASTRPWEKLKEYDFDPEGEYAPAIMDWLSGGKNYFGESFKNPGEINPAEYWNLQGEKESVLSLEDMYYLDIDPTEGNWRLVAGLSNVTTKDKPASAMPKMKLAGLGPTGDDHEGEAANTATQNLLVTLKMTITNTVSEVSYAPYILRAKTPGMTSADHAAFASENWSSTSFKITGDLQNGNPNRAKWVPLRWFYFLPDPGFDLSAAGLRQPRSASFDLNHEAKIEVWDPFEERGAGMTDGWSNYRGKDVWYRWALDARNMPSEVEALKPDSTFID